MEATKETVVVDLVPATDPTDPLDSCAQEPIRIPGAIQRHGFLLCLSEDIEEVAAASENAEEFLHVPLKLILGARIELLFERELLSAVRQLKCSIDPDGLVSYLGTYPIRSELFSVATHCIEGRRVLEFERQDRLVSAEMMSGVITNFVGILSRVEDTQELCEAFTRQFAQLTGFDRVLLYSFNEEGHGTVLSEANNGRLPSYLDLRFPASDIPAQARELYVLNTVRIIPNATYVPSPVRSLPTRAPHILDLSLSILRSVSPVHLEYMRNMGTLSSMSVSILVEGKLWGLISGHHAEPRTVPYLVRSACDMLSKMVGTQLTTFRTTARLQTMVHFHAVQRRLLTRIAAESDYLLALSQDMDSVMNVTAASGAVLWDKTLIACAGQVPSTETLSAIVAWLDDTQDDDLYVTRELPHRLPAVQPEASLASGLLAIRISDRQRYLLWFKQEVLQTVKWAGEPVKLVDPSDRLHPRTSFSSWQELLTGQSERWSAVEVESAREFRAAIVSVSLERAEEEAELSAARFLQLTHTLPSLVFTCDDGANLTYANERWHEQGMPSSGEWFSGGCINPEDEARCRKMWDEVVNDGRPEFEEEVRLRNGERWMLVRITPFRREGKRRAGWVGFMLDLTERRERETALRMTEKLALTGRMTSVIAHEINNPLESITNLMYLLRSEVNENPSAGEYISMVENELERISGITKQTLRWNRENQVTYQDCNIHDMFDEVFRLFRGKARNRRINIHRNEPRDLRIKGVLGQLRQVLANLVSNAIDAANLGGNVTVDATQTADKISITVADDGAGMPPEIQKEIFKPFFSTKGDLGNGLGLYISHEIVERHHGTISVETAPGRGTVVVCTFPRGPVQSEKALPNGLR